MVHYVINGYISADEHKAEITTYKFQKLGNKDKRYGWIAIDSYHGIGTGTDDFGEKTEQQGLMYIINYLDNSELFKYIYTDNFDDVIEARNKIKKELESLKDDKGE